MEVFFAAIEKDDVEAFTQSIGEYPDINKVNLILFY